MEELNRRIGIARRALSTLREVLGEPKTSIVRGAAIQRFEYSFLAEEIYSRLASYSALMEAWLEAMARKAAGSQ